MWLGRRVAGAGAAGVLAVVCLAVYPVLAGATGGSDGSRSAARHVSSGGLWSLPVAAQGPVSSALGADSSEYRVRSGRSGLYAGSGVRGLRMGFGRSGVVVGSGSSRLALRLAAVGFGDRLHSLGDVTPRSRGNRVSYGRAGVDEWYANGPLGLEQGFTLRGPVAGGSGLLTLSLELGGDLRPVLDPGGRSLTFDGADGRPVLSYVGLLATDARGRRLPASLSLRDDRLQIRIGAVGAAFPLRVDPFIQPAELAASDGATDDRLGYSVAVSGDGSTVVAAAPYHTVGGKLDQGAV
jgi:trimeric autotransporter adhesin